jgi:hypothetical protein
MPGGFVAKVAIVIARTGDNKVLKQMDHHLEAVEIHATDVRSLQVRAARYACDAIGAVGDPGNGAIGVAIDAAVNSGTDLKNAGRGAIVDRDA